MSPMPYSLERGDSKYPYHAGNLVRLKQTKLMMNRKANLMLDHEVFFWVMKELVNRKPGRRPQQCKIRVWTCYRPVLPKYRDAYLLRERIVKIQEIIKWMYGGFELIASDVPFNRNISCYQKPYQLIGLIEKE
jgi:hypothetical protein